MYVYIYIYIYLSLSRERYFINNYPMDLQRHSPTELHFRDFWLAIVCPETLRSARPKHTAAKGDPETKTPKMNRTSIRDMALYDYDTGVCEKAFLLRQPLALQSSSRNCSPAPDLVL